MMFPARYQDKIVPMSLDKNARMFLANNARMYLASNVRMFQDSSAVMFHLKSVAMFQEQDKDVGVFPVNNVNRFPNRFATQLSLPMERSNKCLIVSLFVMQKSSNPSN